MSEIPFSKLEKGSLLIACPEIETGIFFRSVVLLCEHNPGGSFGLVINKHLELDLPSEIIEMKDLQNPHVGLRAGGPVQTNQMMLLHSDASMAEQTVEICPKVFLGGDLQFLQETVLDEDGPYVHLCFGYAGWAAGQLEREFFDGSWYLCPASFHNVFEVSAEKLWQTLLREMGGKYTTLSMIPEDLSLN